MSWEDIEQQAGLSVRDRNYQLRDIFAYLAVEAPGLPEYDVECSSSQSFQGCHRFCEKCIVVRCQDGQHKRERRPKSSDPATA